MTQQNFTTPQGITTGNITLAGGTIQGVENGLTLYANQPMTINHDDTDAITLDASNVSVSCREGNVVLSTNYANNNWIFDATGNLTLPGNISGNYINLSGVATQLGMGTNGSPNQLIITIATYPGITAVEPGWRINGPSIVNGTVASAGVYNTNYYVIDTGDRAITAGQLYTFTEPGGVAGGQITGARNIVIGTDGGDYAWTFDATGALTLPSGGGPGGGGFVQTADGYPTLLAYGAGGHGGPELDWTDTDNPNGLFDDAVLRNTMYLNDSGLYIGINENEKANVFSGSWTFGTDGNLTLPGNLIVASGIVGTGASPAPYLSGFSTVSAQTLSASGNITADYFVGNGSQLTGITAVSSYGNANVAANLAAFGSNPISTTGNATVGNLIATANVLANGYAQLTGTFDESQAATAGLYLGYAGGTPRIMFGTGNTAQTLEIDNDGGTLRFYKPGTTLASLTDTGVFSATGNIVSSGNITANYFVGNGSLLTGIGAGGNSFATISANGTSVVANSSADTVTFTAGNNLIITGNASSDTVTFAVNDAPTFAGNVTAANLITSGSAGNIVMTGGNITGANNISANNISATANISGATAILTGAATGIFGLDVGVSAVFLANTVASFTSNVNNYTQITNQNINTGADATADFVLTADNGSDTTNFGDLGIINSGYDNNTPTNSLGNIVFAADTYLYAQGNVSNVSQAGGNLAIGTTVAGKTVKIFAGGNTASALVATVSNTGITMNSGNITGANNISATGNITGGNVLTGGLISATGTITSNGAVSGQTLYATNASGDEGGEMQLTKPPNGTLGGGITVDAYINKLRVFEQGGTIRGMYFDIANCPAGINAAVGYRDIPQVAFTANATLAATDAGKHYYSTLSTGNTLTIANNTSVSWSIGTAVTVVNRGTGNIVIAQGSGVSLYLAGNATAGNRTISTYGMATLLNVAGNTWMINGTGVT